MGFKFDKGSSRFLVIVAVYLIKRDKTEVLVNQIKEGLHLNKDYEFKFSRSKNKFKKKFFQFLQVLPVKYKAIVVDKKKIKASGLQLQPQQLYCELIRRLLYDNNPPLERAILIIDEAAAKIHHKEFNQVLKKYLSKNLIKKIQQKRSKGDIMIQIADMIAGSIFRRYKRNDDQYYQMIKEKEKIIVEF